ncbi:transcriptional regulator [Edaphobacter acidisoli]|uniref:Transcriptional regulator n=1 Tax=Edaphobacter acidisoli TaxID=2040573 RepID=A0A916W8R5_9BACT|nr:YciI family protein [Edaphobacter acidisoli]GGA77291.1 transcriptional regulator [Edaphobacter acidisoli]
MRFLCVYKPSKPEGTPPSETEMMEMGKLISDMTNEGVLLATEGCLPSALGARVRKSGDDFKVTDGPFTEAKEVVGGFALIEVRSKQEAIEQTRRFLKVAGDGECEIRQICEVPSMQLA